MVSATAEPMLVPIETALCKEYFPVVLGCKVFVLNDDTQVLLAQSPNQGGTGITNPVELDASLHCASERASTVLVETLTTSGSINLSTHIKCVRAVQTEAQQAW